MRGVATMLATFNLPRHLYDSEGYWRDVRSTYQGTRDLVEHLSANPHDFNRLVLDSETWRDNPGRWWGAVAPDLLLSAAGGGAGLVGRLSRGATASRGAGSAAHRASSTPHERAEPVASSPGRSLPMNPEPGTPEYELGFDTAVGRFRPAEYETARRLVQELGVELTRAPTDSRVDWLDTAGRTYDAMGNFAGEFLRTPRQWAAFVAQLDLHGSKADFVPIDVSAFDAEQIRRIRELIADRDEDTFFLVGE